MSCSSCSCSDKPKFGYWKIRGLVGHIRQLLAYNKTDYQHDEYVVTGEQGNLCYEHWSNVKESMSLDFPNLPYYIDGEVKLTQSGAIFRYLGRKYNMVGDGASEQAQVDVIIDECADWRVLTSRVAYMPKEYTAKVTKALEEFLPIEFGRLDKLLGSNDYFVGNHLTIADFVAWDMIDISTKYLPSIIKQFPNIERFHQRFAALPAIASYNLAHKYMLNNKSASVNYPDC